MVIMFERISGRLTVEFLGWLGNHDRKIIYTWGGGGGGGREREVTFNSKK